MCRPQYQEHAAAFTTAGHSSRRARCHHSLTTSGCATSQHASQHPLGVLCHFSRKPAQSHSPAWTWAEEGQGCMGSLPGKAAGSRHLLQQSQANRPAAPASLGSGGGDAFRTVAPPCLLMHAWRLPLQLPPKYADGTPHMRPPQTCYIHNRRCVTPLLSKI